MREQEFRIRIVVLNSFYFFKDTPKRVGDEKRDARGAECWFNEKILMNS